MKSSQRAKVYSSLNWVRVATKFLKRKRKKLQIKKFTKDSIVLSRLSFKVPLKMYWTVTKRTVKPIRPWLSSLKSIRSLKILKEIKELMSTYLMMLREDKICKKWIIHRKWSKKNHQKIKTSTKCQRNLKT